MNKWGRTLDALMDLILMALYLGFMFWAFYR
jgi:hypothetical protein